MGCGEGFLKGVVVSAGWRYLSLAPSRLEDELSRVRNLALSNRTNLFGGDGDNRGSLASERHKFDFVSVAVRVYVHNDANVTGDQTVFGKRRGEYDSVVFFDHVSKDYRG